MNNIPQWWSKPSEITAIKEIERVKFTDRLSDYECNVGRSESCQCRDAVAEAHEGASVLWRDVHMIDVVAAGDKTAHGNSQYE